MSIIHWDWNTYINAPRSSTYQVACGETFMRVESKQDPKEVTCDKCIEIINKEKSKTPL